MIKGCYICGIGPWQGQKELPAARGLLNKIVCYKNRVVVGSLSATNNPYVSMLHISVYVVH